MNENMPKKIDDKALEGITGGAIFNANNICGSNPEKPWEVIDDKNGMIVEVCGQRQAFATKGEAIEAAERLGKNPSEVYWDQVLQMRGQK